MGFGFPEKKCKLLGRLAVVAYRIVILLQFVVQLVGVKGLAVDGVGVHAEGVEAQNLWCSL